MKTKEYFEKIIEMLGEVKAILNDHTEQLNNLTNKNNVITPNTDSDLANKIKLAIQEEVGPDTDFLLIYNSIVGEE